MSTPNDKPNKPANNNAKPEGHQTRVTVNTFVFKCDGDGVPRLIQGELKNNGKR